MVTREYVISGLRKLGGVTTDRGKYYNFDESQFNKEPKSGANGFVLKAFDKENNDVAVKFYFPRNPSDYKIEKDNRNRFLNEISILEKAEHRNLIECLGKGEISVREREVPFYVMPYAKGSMRNLLGNGKFNDINFTHCFFQKLGSVIQYLHNQEVNGEKCYHRDLKPENVLFMGGKEGEPLLADLGLAHINPKFAKFEVDSAQVFRNPYYCAPEQIFGDAKEVDHRVDIYAFGYILREALTGKHPRGENAPFPSEKINSEYIALDAVVIKCTEFDREKRYQSMDECLKELKVAINGKPDEKEQLAEFYIARQKLGFLTRHWTLTSDLLSAGNLKALYLNDSFKPSDEEKRVIFHNLLLGGKKRYHAQRAKTKETKTSLNSPSSLGWRWFTDMEKNESLGHIRRVISHHQDIFVRAGGIRALGRIGSSGDALLFREIMHRKYENPRIVSEAIWALALVGTNNDIKTIRESFKNDNRAEVLEALVDVLSVRNDSSGEDLRIISEILKGNKESHKKLNVRRKAVKALGFIAKLEEGAPILQEIISNSNEDPQVRNEAEKALNRLKGLSMTDEDSYVRSIRKIKDRCGLSDDYNEENRTKAWKMFWSKDFYRWSAGLEWLIVYEREKILDILKTHGWELSFIKIEALDYNLYCPQWWYNTME